MQRRSGLEYAVRENTDDQEEPKLHPAYGGKRNGRGEASEYRTSGDEDHKEEQKTNPAFAGGKGIAEAENYLTKDPDEETNFGKDPDNTRQVRGLNFTKDAAAGTLTDQEKMDFLLIREDGELQDEAKNVKKLGEAGSADWKERKDFMNDLDVLREEALADIGDSTAHWLDKKKAAAELELGYEAIRAKTTENWDGKAVDESAHDQATYSHQGKWSPEKNLDWPEEHMKARNDAVEKFAHEAARETLTDQEKADFLTNRDERNLQWTATAIETFKNNADPTEKEKMKFKDVVELLSQEALEDVEDMKANDIVKNKAKMAIREGADHILNSTGVNREAEEQANEAKPGFTEESEAGEKAPGWGGRGRGNTGNFNTQHQVEDQVDEKLTDEYRKSGTEFMDKLLNQNLMWKEDTEKFMLDESRLTQEQIDAIEEMHNDPDTQAKDKYNNFAIAVNQAHDDSIDYLKQMGYNNDEMEKAKKELDAVLWDLHILNDRDLRTEFLQKQDEERKREKNSKGIRGFINRFTGNGEQNSDSDTA